MTVADYARENLGFSHHGWDTTPVESWCGYECRDVIDNAAELIGRVRKVMGDDGRDFKESTQQIATTLVETIIHG